MAEMVTLGSKPEANLGERNDSVASGQPQAEGQATPADGVQVTNSAAARIRVLLAKEGISPAEGGLRLGVIGGGCSGHSYSMRLEARPRERDHIFAFEDARVFIDPKSFVFLKGMTLDYEETLIRQGFNFINPNATRSCGCGTSFST
ncbi:MAG TPA: iron-sulfur cluster assembly accessory protein [Terracidiphilus sp.]|nr:iron-sulfur cluster assembly accessory protein [Terracidiphilus sp.]